MEMKNCASSDKQPLNSDALAVHSTLLVDKSSVQMVSSGGSDQMISTGGQILS